MPIELKKPISSIAELTCENCIHYQKSGEDWCCINPDSYEWDRLSGDTRVVCNPRGYPPFNQQFNPNLVVEV